MRPSKARAAFSPRKARSAAWSTLTSTGSRDRDRRLAGHELGIRKPAYSSAIGKLPIESALRTVSSTLVAEKSVVTRAAFAA